MVLLYDHTHNIIVRYWVQHCCAPLGALSRMSDLSSVSCSQLGLTKVGAEFPSPLPSSANFYSEL